MCRAKSGFRIKSLGFRSLRFGDSDSWGLDLRGQEQHVRSSMFGFVASVLLSQASWRGSPLYRLDGSKPEHAPET